MGDTPFGSSARLSGDFERSYERERERLEGMFNVAYYYTIVDGYLTWSRTGIGNCHCRDQWRPFRRNAASKKLINPIKSHCSLPVD